MIFGSWSRCMIFAVASLEILVFTLSGPRPWCVQLLAPRPLSLCDNYSSFEFATELHVHCLQGIGMFIGKHMHTWCLLLLTSQTCSPIKTRFLLQLLAHKHFHRQQSPSLTQDKIQKWMFRRGQDVIWWLGRRLHQTEVLSSKWFKFSWLLLSPLPSIFTSLHLLNQPSSLCLPHLRTFPSCSHGRSQVVLFVLAGKPPAVIVPSLLAKPCVYGDQPLITQSSSRYQKDTRNHLVVDCHMQSGKYLSIDVHITMLNNKSGGFKCLQDVTRKKTFCNILPTLNYFYTFYVSTQTFSSKLKIKKKSRRKKKERNICRKNVMAYTSFELLFHLVIIVN